MEFQTKLFTFLYNLIKQLSLCFFFYGLVVSQAQDIGQTKDDKVVLSPVEKINNYENRKSLIQGYYRKGFTSNDLPAYQGHLYEFPKDLMRLVYSYCFDIGEFVLWYKPLSRSKINPEVNKQLCPYDFFLAEKKAHKDLFFYNYFMDPEKHQNNQPEKRRLDGWLKRKCDATTYALAAHPQKPHVAIITNRQNKKIVILNISTQKIEQTLEGHDKAVSSIVYDATDHHYLISGGYDHIIMIWNTNTGQWVEKLYHTEPVLTLTTNGRWLVAGGEDGTLQLWEKNKKSLSKGREPIWINSKMLYTSQGAIKSLAFSPNKAQFVSGSEHGEIIVWDVNGTKNALKKTKGIVYITSITYEPCGKKIFVGNHFGEMFIFETAYPECCEEIRACDSSIRELCYAPHHKKTHLTATYEDGNTIIWDEQKIIANPKSGFDTLPQCKVGNHRKVPTDLKTDPNSYQLLYHLYFRDVVYKKIEQFVHLLEEKEMIVDSCYTADSKFVTLSNQGMLRVWIKGFV